VALCGVEDLIIVVRSGADGSPASVLVCRRGESQKVKNIVDLIKADGRPDLL
jgi:mannose-1-phosphate guanylyltransferase/mannose-1-phosphate guanylyltransferase/mannose-6-phosphate isomerase